jgi:transposase
MDTSKLRKDWEQGKPVDVGALLDMIDQLTHALAEASKKLDEATKKINELTKSNKLEQPFSVRSHEQSSAKKKPKKNRKPNNPLGRKRNQTKIAAADRTEVVYPKNFPKDECSFSHTRPVWRLEDNQAVIVAYDVWVHKATKTYGKIPGVIGRSGYGIEFLLAVAFQVYTLGLSMDKVVLLTHFFQKLKLGKSQIDSMLNQIARHLEGEFDHLCSLVANSMIVHADETGWSIHSVWAFVTEQARLLLHGVHKDAATLEKILNPESFQGLVISDDSAVYSKFSKMQKCWAHLLRKAVRICLLDPNEKRFEALRDGLFVIYRSAKRLKKDARFNEIGRHNAMIGLQNELYDLICPECEKHEGKSYEGAMEAYRLLLAELLRLNVDDQLFTFVTTPSVERPNGTEMQAEGTNNESERTLRSPASARNNDRASKTLRGAKRRTIIVSTMESMRCFMNRFTLENVTQEILAWAKDGVSCFEKRLSEINDAVKLTGMLEKLYPNPSTS